MRTQPVEASRRRGGPAWGRLTALIATSWLAACAEPPPPAPMLVAVPGATKTAQAFAQDDVLCRSAAQPSGTAPSATTTALLPLPSSYLRCMAARGNVITQASTSSTTVTYLAYPTTYPWPYFDWGWWWGFGPGVAPGPGPGGGSGPGGGPGPGGAPPGSSNGQAGRPLPGG